MHERALSLAVHAQEVYTFLLITDKDFLHAQRCCAVVDKDVGFEIVLEATEVDVRRTAGAERIVSHKQLAVVESSLVKHYLNACLKHLRHERHRRKFKQARVAMTRNHQSHIYAGKCCRAHGEEHLLSRQEVRRLHVYIVLRLKQYAHISLHDVRPFGNRTARHDLHQAVVVYAPRHRRIVF